MSDAKFLYPDALVSTDWLDQHLSDPDVRVFDCTTYLKFDMAEAGQPYGVVSGRADYEAGHIPRSGFLDLQGDFSVADSPYLFTLPSPEETAGAFARNGIGNGTRVVLYSRAETYWATRFWWMLRWLGFDEAAILNGGYQKWVADGGAVSQEPCSYPSGDLSISLRPELFIGKDEVLAAIGQPAICTIDAMRSTLHTGEDPRFARPGHVPGSKNVPASTLVHSETGEIISAETAGQTFDAVGVAPGKRIITYCGSGIAATMDAFMLHQLGYRDIAVYDNSMGEWAVDESLPIEAG